MSISIFDLFKIGIGPSSSHTVGPMIAARQFVESLENTGSISQTNRICAEMFGSLGATGKGHGTPGAVLMGLLSEHPATVNTDEIDQRVDKIRTTSTIKLGNHHSIPFDIKTDLVLHRRKSLPYHANGMRFSAFDNNDKLLSERHYYSVGGGFVVDEEQAKSGDPLVADTTKLPYAFQSGEALLKQCDETGSSIAELMYANEQSWRTREKIDQQIDDLWQTMRNCVDNGCRQQGNLPGGLNVKRRAYELHQQLLQQQPGADDQLEVLDWVTLYALAVNEENASGGRIVTAPTNGAAGIVPAVLHYYWNFIDKADLQGVRNFLLTSAAIGILFKENASISGAEVGCQGEVGSACSMAAAGLAAVLGGTPQQVENAAEIAMEHHLGLTCDPIAGLVQIPCIERNAVASVNAIHAARIALRSDGSHFVSLDKVIATMRETGKDMMDKYKETARGGLATQVIEVPVNFVEC